MSGIQTGDNEVNEILAGTWTFERTDADKKADDSSVSQILPGTDTGAKEVGHQGARHDPRADVPHQRHGYLHDANGTPLAFEFALNR